MTLKIDDSAPSRENDRWGIDAKRVSYFSFQTPSAIDRFNGSLSKPNTALDAIPRFTNSNPCLVSGRHSPVYVAVPVDRPPVKVKPKARASAHDTLDISAIIELRNKLLSVDDSGLVQLNQCNDVMAAMLMYSHTGTINLVPRVFWLIGQRVNARRDSGVLGFCYRRVSAVKKCKPLRDSQSKNLISFFESPESLLAPTPSPKS